MTYPKITFTMTTSKRLDLFIITMQSFFNTCLDRDLICRWIISDDGSSLEDLRKMQELYPFFEIYSNDFGGQNKNLNFLWNLIKTEWFFHCEDDWLFLIKDNYIRKMFDVVNQNDKIKNITLRHWVGNISCLQDKNIVYNIHKYSPGAGTMSTTNCEWFGYSLNPGLQHKPTLDSFGEYPSESSGEGNYARYWDRVHALKYLEKGYLAANLVGPYIEHIGWENSTYA